MANIRPVTDLQRKFGEVAEFAEKTKEPIYLTKRGNKYLILIDADEFDRIQAIADACGSGGADES